MNIMRQCRTLSERRVPPQEVDMENPPVIQKISSRFDSSEKNEESFPPVPAERSRCSETEGDSMSARQKSYLIIVICFVIFLGAAACGAFMAIGISSAKNDQKGQFESHAKDLVNRIQRSWEDYVTAAAYIHGRCRGRNFTRTDFRLTYEYLIGSGLNFQAAQFEPNITHKERPAMEAEARKFYEENYPTVEYRGIVGLNYENSTTLEPRHQADFYFPINYMEPVPGNERAIDLDYLASGTRKRTVLFCMNNGLPALTDRLVLVQEKKDRAFGVVLMHPGFYSSLGQEVWPRDLASIVIRIPDLILRAAYITEVASVVYIYDTSDSSGAARFLGAAEIGSTDILEKKEPGVHFLDEIELEELRRSKTMYREEVVLAANKEWIVAVHALEGDYKPDAIFVIVGGLVIFAASACLAYWIAANHARMNTFSRMRAQAEMDRAALVLDNTRQTMKAERDLNDFIAHEVRNPVAAAMSACSFVKAAVNESQPLITEASRIQTRDDIEIIDNSLRFVNDLLRSMLDIHRALDKQLVVNMTPTDVLHDVLEPVQAIMPRSGSRIKISVECPEGLVVMTDRLRLKQVCLNLGRNSLKFVNEGFICFRAEIRNQEVQISVEDSGPGIPEHKHEMLFIKFQESLDSLSQGTGMGLFLCQNLVRLMDGDIYLDEGYISGVKENPGTRFVVNLRRGPVDPQLVHDNNSSSGADTGNTLPIEESVEADASDEHELPETLNLLFVDDDPILRKLFSRCVRTVAPKWVIREASSGETALRLAEEEPFDLIFMDMYMASVEKQLLGTETVRELRSRGVTCQICGLSANDKEAEFLEAGANAFIIKPFPCQAKTLMQELLRCLYSNGQVD